MVIYILGSDSYIAKRFYEKTKHRNNCKRVSRSSKDKDYSFDLIDKQSFDFNLINPKDVILFFAAASSPDYCKENPKIAEEINVKGTSLFIKKFLEKKAKILFFSSDGVFSGGEKTFYEESERNPISYYGKMKLSIEKEFENNKNVKIFRLSYIYSKQDKFSSYLEECVKKKCQVEVYPILRNAVYIEDLVEGIDNLIINWDDWNNFSFNICGEQLISRKEIAEIFSKNVSPLEIKIVEPGEEFFKGRPRVIKMKSHFFPELLGRNPISINKAMLKEYSSK